jgi:hypothetical protein
VQVDLLTDPIFTVFAVNCRIDEETLFCGGLYLDPLIQSARIQLSHSGGTIQVQLPPQTLNRAGCFRAWDVELPIVDS